ncbi:hypothetical protein GTR04_2331 [Trichophyton interdigitale]|uniref:Uncharacterized protein n=1 Tax=Trichophyton interdigitale TaxID=101480 RepID=A0A9P4YKS7_9EURO|nr:hypothetical protein GY632_1992 [Trichophyton interdigitale]KAF3900578.1 hypothetical protein GY631_0032 [Trichophyton interdigitale]KAG8210264.1 hypothetical protein GTR04_2331 [Trichophyton interdigitale]
MELKLIRDEGHAIELTYENADRVKSWLHTLPAKPISPGDGSSLSPGFANAHLMERCRHPECAFQVRLISVHNHTHHREMSLEELYPVPWTASDGSTGTGATFLTAKSHQTTSDGGDTEPEEPNDLEKSKEPQGLEEREESVEPEDLEEIKEPDEPDDLPKPEGLEELGELKGPEYPEGQEKQAEPEEREEHKKLEEHDVPEVHSELGKHDEPEELPPRKQQDERPQETEEMDYLATRVKERTGKPRKKPRKKPQKKPDALVSTDQYQVQRE